MSPSRSILQAKLCPCGSGRPLIVYHGRRCLVCGPCWEEAPPDLRMALSLPDVPLEQKRAAARELIDRARMKKRQRLTQGKLEL